MSTKKKLQHKAELGSREWGLADALSSVAAQFEDVPTEDYATLEKKDYTKLEFALNCLKDLEKKYVE